MKVNCSSVT